MYILCIFNGPALKFVIDCLICFVDSGSVLVFVTAFGKTNLLNETNKIHFIALLPFTSTEDAALLI